MRFRQRFVRFGTGFSGRDDEDRQSESQFPPELLLRNEIAVDIGSTCWGWKATPASAPERLRIIDHHFQGGDRQYPSASAGVLDFEQTIWDWAGAMPANVSEIWAVSHQDPDFDALCAITLVEDIVKHGPAAPEQKPRNWFEYQPEEIEARHRWRYQLAAVASITDQCKRTLVPRHRTLHAMLYACGKRGEQLTDYDFRRRFFEVVRRELAQGRNALTDSVLEDAAEFALEREFLDRQDSLYARDIRRARKVVVSVPVEPRYPERYAELCTLPLLDSDGHVAPEHAMADNHSVPVDGVFLRDPECMLFKEFVRQDLDNSPTGRGFVFSAIVYPQAKENWHAKVELQAKDGPLNRGDYYFSLNPEAIPGAHLYPLWARLQESEVEARVASGRPSEEARGEYRKRAVGPRSGHFKDPWFDGGSYRGTIIVTPGPGTWIGPAGEKADLSDDPVARIVRDYFESAQWAGREVLEDFAASEKAVPKKQEQQVLDKPNPLTDEAYRFAAVALRPESKLFEANLGADIARRLWRTLAPNTEGGPRDFEERHVVIIGAATGCWNRHGVAVAYHDNEEGRRVRDRLRKMIESMAVLAREISKITGGQKRDVNGLRELLQDVADLKWQAAQPDVRLARRFFDAIGFERELSLVHDLHHAQASSDTLRDIVSLQRSAGVLEIMVLGVYALEAAHLFTSRAHETHFGWTLAYMFQDPQSLWLLTSTPVSAKSWKRKNTCLSGSGAMQRSALAPNPLRGLPPRARRLSSVIPGPRPHIGDSSAS